MKHFFWSVLLFSAFTTALSAQTDADNVDKVKRYRIAVFTEVLNLTPDEAQGFWPIYNEYMEKREAIQKQLKPSRQLDGMKDSEVEDYLKQYFDLKQQEIDAEKDLALKLRKVLPVRKIAKMPVAEREFREGLIQKLKEFRERKAERQQLRQGNRLKGGN